MKILIVEDEAIPAMVLNNHLKKRGADVIGPVSTGEEAVMKAKEKCPDVILMDIRLAGEMDGIEAANKTLSEIQTSIIFMSGYMNDTVIERVKDLKSVQYLHKPLNMGAMDLLLGYA